MQKYLILFLFPVFAFAQMGTDLRLGKFDKIDSNSATEISTLKELEALTTGAWKLPIGDTAARPAGAAGQIRYNSELLTFEGYTDAWGPIAGGGGLLFWEEDLEMELNDIVYRNDNKKIYKVTEAHTATATFDEAKLIEIANPSSFSLLKNPDFENTIVEYACTDATAAIVATTLPIYNNFKMFQMDVTTIGGYCDFTATTGAAMEGMLFRMGGEFQTSLAGVEYCTLVNGAVDNCIPIPSGTTWKTPLATQSLAGATSVGIRIRSTTVTGVVNADKLQLKIGGLPTGPTISCDGDLDCENVFSARVGSSRVVSGENIDWISGNCTDANPAVCTFVTGLFTVTPNCSVSGENSSTAANISAHIQAISSTSISVMTGYNSTVDKRGFHISCTKAAPDFKPITQQGVVNVGEIEGEKWTEYTPTFEGLGTVTNVYARYRRDGQNIEVYGRVTAGTVTSTSAKISLPSGLLLDQDNVPSGSLVIVGKAARSATSTDQFHMITGSGETTKVLFARMSTGGLQAVGGNDLMSTSNSISFNFSVPIQGWSDRRTVVASIIDRKIYDGNEYLAGEVAVISGVEKTVYRRCYEIASTITGGSTIATLPAGLIPTEWVVSLNISNPNSYYGPNMTFGTTDYATLRYNDSTGNLGLEGNVGARGIIAGRTFCFKYRKD